ncbi:hypothetical protein DFQ05_2041 [Winogradskyella wandonensis]|uniref:Uncharacterized protein n=1 Tax=Winogradskyella wandonensis TaxID=1442586 RepID=A0A4R1KQI9_9FLAO|nr:hypothetical protein [Winogradskyella wandonensis]TCK66767.1 hypothetical protein DFQ05_2041 [Winogradskyella wandonensis]
MKKYLVKRDNGLEITKNKNLKIKLELSLYQKNKTHPYRKIRMGKNCYEKEKLPLISISDNSNILFFMILE